MNIPGLRSPYENVGGYLHLGRMLDKIRLHQAGQLPAEYHGNLGGGFDGRLCAFLGVKYEDLVGRVKLGGTDLEVLSWCHQNGRQPSVGELELLNGFLQKRGWNDEASDRLAERVKQLGPQWVGKIQTFFDLIEVDEGRPPRCR